MIYQTNINTNLTITTLQDLLKIIPFIKEGILKPNKSQIARELGKDRRTIAKYLDGYVKPSTRNKPSKIDPFYDQIKFLLSDQTTQIFYYKRVLWQFLKDNHGLDCSESSFRRYILNHKDFHDYFKKRKPAVSSKPSVMRFETPPAAQAQLDWKEKITFTLKNGETITVYVFVLLLSYSRFRVYRLSLSTSQELLFSFLNDAFETFDGVPQEILTDNMKTVMDQARKEYKKGKINVKFKQFADDYGFEVKPCIAGRPQTKAKVESPMKLLDEIYAYNGLLDYEELNRLVECLNERVNAKVHQGTGKIPAFYFQKEKPFLSPLPKESIRKAYKISVQTCKVNASAMITYKQNQYSVPPEYIGKRLCIQVYDHYLHVYDTTKLITLHPICGKKLNYKQSHYEAISSLTLNEQHLDIKKIATENLKQIGAMYQIE